MVDELEKLYRNERFAVNKSIGFFSNDLITNLSINNPDTTR